MGYLHVDIEISQSSKHPQMPCGDVVSTIRNASSTTIILADGLGHGMKANIAANMVVARIKELLNNNFTLRQAFGNVVKTMEEARVNDLPYAVFTVVRILEDGLTTILSYEMPEALLVQKRFSSLVDRRTMLIEKGIVGESDFKLNYGEALILMSDGITQAGLGKGLPLGWESSGVSKYLNEELKSGTRFRAIPAVIRKEAINKWKGVQEDDCTVVAVFSRPGKVVNILTGPPINSKDDSKVIADFNSSYGLKIICGATTAKIAARELGKELKIEENYYSNITPVNYYLEGIDLVTEGAITLNQVYNVWDENTDGLDKNNPVTDLYSLLSVVDRVNIFAGHAENPANRDISFAQMGIIKRAKIVNLLTEKLRREGKLVTINNY